MSWRDRRAYRILNRESQHFKNYEDTKKYFMRLMSWRLYGLIRIVIILKPAVQANVQQPD